ncbi:hypothetical protein CLUG_04138 [Clavispora lusitaniae ATCC 42720]|uniref:Uncharacterized protein n=2 Tax=Clavispora lusitaniae TaxID=36911 RepID=C4Y7G0_CLAL4|nr:uncharacterized protein CLUG_04138 [Clavispora lusitaniae ATCC 42720]EEQ40010.1 hypothetical protein CLUG_04138 [Clavispora lusitaniae ATCC 42720]
MTVHTNFGQTSPFEHSHEIIPTNCSAFIEHSSVCIVCIIFSISRVSQHGCICFYEQELRKWRPKNKRKTRDENTCQENSISLSHSPTREEMGQKFLSRGRPIYAIAFVGDIGEYLIYQACSPQKKKPHPLFLHFSSNSFLEELYSQGLPATYTYIKMSTTTTKLNQQEIIPSRTDVGALANRINMETRSLHNKIDKLVTLKFALALRDYKIFRQGLQSFYHVFATIEECLYKQLENEDSEWTPLLRNVWKPEMARREKGQQDLLFYYDGRKEKFMTPIMPAQIEFVNHIRQVTSEKPYLLLAYLHVMYLALFAGGRVMRSSISRATGLFPRKDGLSHGEIVKEGSNFFSFDVEDENTFRLLYKRDYELQTRNNLTEEQKLEIIEESKYIFQQNAKCVIELEHHNLSRIKSKWSYFFVTRGYYIAIAIFFVIALVSLRRIYSHVIA